MTSSGDGPGGGADSIHSHPVDSIPADDDPVYGTDSYPNNLRLASSLKSRPISMAGTSGGGGGGGLTSGRSGGGSAVGSSEGAGSGGGIWPSSRVDVQRLIVGTVSTLLWMVFSSSVIILNKRLYAAGFAYPSTVTGLGQLVSTFSGLALGTVAGQRLRPPPGPRVFLTRLLPIAACTAASMYFGNMAYLHLSVSFIQILKAFTPAITLLLCVLAGTEHAAPSLLASIAMIAGGTAGAVLVESGAPSFSGLGFAAFMASSLTEAARVVGAELLRDGPRYNTAESLVYVGGPTALLLLAGAAVWELPAMLAAASTGGGLGLLAADPWVSVMAPAVSALVNMSCFFAINATSSLTFKVAGCVKNVAVVAYGMVAHGEAVTASQMAGYGVSVLGFMWYSQLKMSAQPPRPKKAKAAAGIRSKVE